MMANFYDSFGEMANNDKHITQEIMDELNKNLPENLQYIEDKDDNYYIVPSFKEGEIQSVMLNFSLGEENEEELCKKLEKIPRENWAEYLYRRQKTVAVKNVQIGDMNSTIPMSQTIGHPLSQEKVTTDNGMLYPGELSEPFSIKFEVEDGKMTEIKFQQQAYDSVTEIKLSNVNFKSIKMDIYIYNPISDIDEENAKTDSLHKVIISSSINPKNAESVEEVIDSIKLFKGLMEGTVKINGKLDRSEKPECSFNQHDLEDALNFWTIARKLEDKIHVHFIPGTEFSMEDAKFFYDLDQCINKKESVIWEHPFKSFHLKGYNATKDGKSLEEIIGMRGIRFEFYEGPIDAKLLGTEFELFSRTELNNIVITNIEWDDETKQSGEVYITDDPDKAWTLSRKYMTREIYENDYSVRHE
jgi:hypothetical protein